MGDHRYLTGLTHSCPTRRSSDLGGSRHNRPPRCCTPTAERGRERRTGASFARPVSPLKSIKHFSKLTEAARLWKKESAARKSSGGRSLSAECKWEYRRSAWWSSGHSRLPEKDRKSTRLNSRH